MNDTTKYLTAELITRDTDLTQEPHPFLVDGIVHQSVTLLYGRTCSGKSTLAAALAIALSNGETEFLGREITSDGPMRVGIITGDPLGASEYKRRLVSDGAIGSGEIQLVAPYRPTRIETWEEVREVIQGQDCGFVIVDNLSSFVPGSLNDDDSVKLLYDQIEQFPRDGIPALVLAHTSDKWTEHGPSRIPMGSSLIRFGPRWWCNAYRSGGRLHLEFDGNEGTPHNINVTEPDGKPAFDVIETSGADEVSARRERRSQERREATERERREMGDYVLAECPELNQTQAAERLSEQYGRKASTHEVNLSRGAYGVKLRNGRWERLSG